MSTGSSSHQDSAAREKAKAISLLKTLGIELKEVGDSHAVMEVRVDETHTNYMGGTHGGLIATLADTVSFFPGRLLPSGLICTTANLNVTFVRPSTIGDTLIARSELVHLGRRMASVTCRIVNAEGKLVAHSSATLMVLSKAESKEVS